jgi:hypothetical protein
MTKLASLEELDARLRALPLTIILQKDDERAVRRLEALRLPLPARVAPRTGQHFRRLTLRGAASAIAVTAILAFGVNLAAAYYAPSYGRALADAPGIGPVSVGLLHFTGLDASDLTVVHDSTTSGGHTIELVAGYADGLRTVLFVRVDGRGVSVDPKRLFGTSPGDYGVAIESISLTDQFGHSYALQAGAQTGNVLTFQPLVWPASQVGGRLTLHVGAIVPEWLIGPSQPTPAVNGDWTLRATLFSESVHKLALPAPIHSDLADYRITSIQSSGTTLTIHWTITGPAVGMVDALWRGGAQNPGMHSADYEHLMQGYFHAQLFDVAGNLMGFHDWGITFASPAVGEMTAFIPGPGRYRLQLGDAVTAPDQQPWITVP